MDMILDFTDALVLMMKDIGVATLVIASITIFIVGCLKMIPGWEKVGKDGRKALYQILNIVLAVGLSIVYHLFMAKGQWDIDMITFAGLVVTEVNILYPIYENLGPRKFLRWVGNSIKALFTKNKEMVIEGKDTPMTSDEVQKKQEKADKTGWLE